MQPQKVEPPRVLPMEERRTFWKRLLLLNWLSILFDFLFLPFAFIVALRINAEGVRQMAINTVTPLIRTRGIRIDSAHVVAIVFLVGVFTATVFALKRIQKGVPEDSINPAYDYWLPITFAVPLLVLDCLCFYMGLVHQTLFRTSLQVIPFLFAIGYTAATVWLAHCHNQLKGE